jgi:hypothetical protein
MTESKPLDRQAAKQWPETIFKRPVEILDAELLTRGEKLATLERWRQNILEQLRATSEGMPADGYSGVRTEVLDEIEVAKRRLTEGKQVHPQERD